jgi:uncharacterized protein YbaR (Trm112 family)
MTAYLSCPKCERTGVVTEYVSAGLRDGWPIMVRQKRRCPECKGARALRYVQRKRPLPIIPNLARR